MAPFNGGNISIARAALATVTLLIALMTWVGRSALEDLQVEAETNVKQTLEIDRLKTLGEQNRDRFLEIDRKLNLLLEERPRVTPARGRE